MKQIFTLFLIAIGFSVIGQTYNMNNTNVTTCSGTFYDSGGNAGAYNNSENFTKTFCPATAGAKIMMNFTLFDTESTFEHLYIYDGNSTGAPLIGNYTGVVGPGLVQASASNASGCLTFVFTSDGSVTYTGWAATISCSIPCQTITSILNSSNPAAGTGSIIRVCKNQPVTFNGSGTFSGSSAGAVYTWNFGNGTSGNGTSASVTYTAAGAYLVNLGISAGGCNSSNNINQIVQVSTTPTSTTSVANPTVCLGQSTTVTGLFTPVPFVVNCTPPVSGTTFIPDGAGLSYNTCINVNCFNAGQTITAASQVQDICVNMEHSYLGDLDISIVCPNGQQVFLKTYAQGGSGTYLGAANDLSTAPGSGFNYCFSMSGAVYLVNGPTVIAGNPASAAIAAGTYLPIGNFSGLVGCPLNGSWCIKVTDNLNSDDGYVYNWDLNFAPGLAPAASSSFTPNIVSQTWSGSNITSTAGNVITVTPAAAGTQCYTLTALDNFNCSYTTTQCLSVINGPFAGTSNTMAACSSAAPTNLFSLLGTGVSTTGTWSGPAPTLTGGNLGTFNPALYTAGVYNYTYTVPASGGCPASTAVVGVTIRPKPSATLTFTNPSCGNNNGVIVIQDNSSGGQTVTFASSGGSLSGQTVTGLSAGTTIITLTNNFGCTFTVSATLSNSPPITDIALAPNNIFCGTGTGSITLGAVTGGTGGFTYAVNGGAFSASPPVTGLTSGTYSITVKDVNGCIFTKTVAITVTPGPTAITGTPVSAACGLSNGSYNITGVTSGTPIYSFSVDAVSTGSLTTGLAPGTHTVLVKDGNNCTFSTTFNIGNLSGPIGAATGTTNASCGSANGSATVTSVTGGTPTYSYSFNGGGFTTSSSIGGLTAGPKTVVVKDANNCTFTVNFTIGNSGSPTASISANSSVTCNGGSNGSLNVTTSGGTPAYTYTIVPTNATNGIGIFTGLTAQTYTVNIKDLAGCTTSVVSTIIQPAAITLALTPSPVACNGASTGTITAAAANGTGLLQYSLNGGAFQVGNTFTGLVAGTYTITVKDANNCTVVQTTIITQPTPLSLSFATSPNACVGSTGGATITPSGGTPVYSYSIDAVSSSSSSSTLGTGTHTATVKDFNGCIISGTFNIGVLAGPTAANVLTTNASCGSSNGTATVTTVTGGTPLYQYSFNGGGFGASTTIGSLTAGTQTLTVKDANNCTLTVNFNINNAGSPSATVSAVSTILCNGASTGSITVITSGGTGPYTYTLTPGNIINTTGVFTGLTAQPYNISVNDMLGCITSVTATITQPVVLTSTLTPFNVNCNAGSNGLITAVASGGTGAYQYSLNGGAFQSGSSFTSLIAGTYSVTVKDVNNCTVLHTVTITQPTALGISFATVPNSCAGSVGSATITVTGGSPSYSYTLDASASSSTPTGLAAGVHTALIKDILGCSITGTFSINSITGPVSGTVVTTNVACGAANGTSTITGVTGGTPTYQYSFDGSAFSTSTIKTGLSAGSHTVVVLDANTCTLSVTYNVSNNGSPTMSVAAVSNVLCNGAATGSFTVVEFGGSGGPYTYTLTSPFQINGNGQFTNLPAGTYTVNGKDIAGCLTGTIVTINQPTPVTLNPVSIAVKCFGSATGTVNVTGAGGTPSYSFQINGTGFQASGSFTTVSAGAPVIQIKDANGCVATQTVLVTQPTALAISASAQNANCTASNGVASSTVTGGTPPYNYTWTGGGGSGSNTGGVPSGSYTVTTTDNNGCTISAVAVIGNTPGGTAAITGSTGITCNNANNGILTAGMTSGGTNPLTYSWSPGGQVTSAATNLAPGTYTCKITDNFGCIVTAIGSLTQPPILTALMNSNNAKCFGASTGTISAAGTGGTGPYTYLWTTLASTLATVNNVAVGTYTCDITDSKNCIIHPTITVTQPSSITITSTVSPANCGQANGSATVNPTGGTPSYSYTWSAGSTTTIQNSIGAGTYTIIVKDANNCTYTVATTVPNLTGPSISITSFTNVSCFGGTNGGATSAGTGGTGTLTYLWNGGGPLTPSATNFLAGVHTVTVTDATGCAASASVNIFQPTALSVSITPTNPKCFGASNGFGIGAAFGGTSGYSYSWTGGGGTNPTSVLLPANIYVLNVTDSKNCIATASMTLVNPPAMLTSITSTNNTCFNSCNGIAAGASTNNIGTVSYYWIGGPGPITAQTITGLCAGNYTLTATDQNNCTASAQVIITQPTPVTASISLTGTVTCNGGTNGFAQANASGGTGALTYSWTGAAAAAGNSAIANNLPAGTYTVTVKDQNLCSATAQAIIIQPTPLATTLTTTNPKCNGVADGTGNVAFSGGSGSTTFFWQPGLQSGNTVNNLSVGAQTVTITSNAACPTILTFTLTQPALLTAVTSATSSNCGQMNGVASATVSGGTGAYTSLWSNNAVTFSNAGILAGGYTYTVTDANGCKAVSAALINDIAAPTVVVTSTTAVKCFGGNDGAATTTITGGVLPYAIVWNNNASNSNNVNNFFASATPYIENVTDAAGCVGTASLIISQPTQLNTAINTQTNVTCFGLTNGQAAMSVTGGVGGYTYTWSPSGQSSAVMSGVGANTYTCFVTDANNCPSSKVVTITQPPALSMASSSFTNISCFGGNTGQIVTNVVNGTLPYNYVWSPTQINSGNLSGLGVGGYSLTVTDFYGCPINSNFMLSSPPVITSSYVSTPAKCELANGAATVTPLGGTSTYTLNWNVGAQQGVTATGLAPITYSCTITDSNGCSKVQSVAIAAAPSPTITSITTTTPSCPGSADAAITVNYISGTPNYTVAWSNPIIPATQTTSGLSQTAINIAAGLYTVTVTDSYGCNNQGVANVPLLNPLVITPSANLTICYGQSAQISAQGAGGNFNFPYSYTWTPAFNNTGGPHTVSPTATTSYTVNMSDINNCTAAPKVITVSVTPQIVVTPKSYTVCDGYFAPLTPTVTGGNGSPYTYAWTPGASTISPLYVAGNYITSPNHYTLTVNDGDGCSSASAAVIFTVVVNPLPKGHFTVNTPTLCIPGSVQLTAISNNSLTDTYTWYNDKNQIGTTNPFSYPITKEDSITIGLHIVNQYGCFIDTEVVNAIISHPYPTASFMPYPQTTSIIDPTITFTNTSVGAIKYAWSFGDATATNGTNLSGIMHPNHTYGYVGVYTVNLVVTNVYGCTDDVSEIVEITPDFALYIPNSFTPNGDGVNDSFFPAGVGINEDNYRMDIFDRWGEAIFTSNSFRKGWDGSVKGSGKLAEQGVYIYKISVFDMLGKEHPHTGHVTVLRGAE